MECMTSAKVVRLMSAPVFLPDVVLLPLKLQALKAPISGTSGMESRAGRAWKRWAALKKP